MITAGVDMARLFNHVLLQQTQPEDSQGAITITNMYTTWSVMIIAILTCEAMCLLCHICQLVVLAISILKVIMIFGFHY